MADIPDKTVNRTDIMAEIAGKVKFMYSIMPFKGEYFFISMIKLYFMKLILRDISQDNARAEILQACRDMNSRSQSVMGPPPSLSRDNSVPAGARSHSMVHQNNSYHSGRITSSWNINDFHNNLF